MTRRKSTARKKRTHEMEAKKKWYMAYYPPFLSIQCPQNYPCCHCVIVFGEWFSKKKINCCSRGDCYGRGDRAISVGAKTLTN
jgi:hypothetical protein